MRRLVNLWLALLAAYWLTRAAVSSLLFGRVDQGFSALLELIAVPALQALAVGWFTRPAGTARLAPPWRAGWRLRPLRGVLVLDAAVLAAAWLLPGPSCPSCGGWLAPSWSGGLPGWLAAAKLLAAAMLLAAALARPGWDWRDRLAVALLAAGLLALAAEPWRGWLAGLPGWLQQIPSPPVRWCAAYGTLLAAALLLAAPAEAALGRRAGEAALACEWALGLLLLAAFAAVLGFMRQPAAAAGAWSRAAATLGSLSGTALLIGAALAATAARPLSAAGGRQAEPEPTLEGEPA